MRRSNAWLPCLLALLVVGSTPFAGPPPAVDVNDLIQHWVRSYEEERPADTVQVFRPVGSVPFPPSRFRMAYKFAGNGACEWYALSPDDAHRFEPGTWSIDPSDATLLRITADGATSSYRIIELSKTLLKLRPVEPEPRAQGK